MLLGGLLPLSSYNSKGLVINRTYLYRNGGEFIRLRHKNNTDVYSPCVVDMCALSNGVTSAYKLIVSGYQIDQNKVVRFGGDIGYKFYKKVVDGITENIIFTSGNGGCLFEIACQKELVISGLGSTFDVSTYQEITQSVIS